MRVSERPTTTHRAIYFRDAKSGITLNLRQQTNGDNAGVRASGRASAGECGRALLLAVAVLRARACDLPVHDAAGRGPASDRLI